MRIPARGAGRALQTRTAREEVESNSDILCCIFRVLGLADTRSLARAAQVSRSPAAQERRPASARAPQPWWLLAELPRVCHVRACGRVPRR